MSWVRGLFLVKTSNVKTLSLALQMFYPPNNLSGVEKKVLPVLPCAQWTRVNVHPWLCFVPPQMSWRPTYRSSKFRNVYGKVANREHCFDGVPITKNVHDNHFCAVNSKFVAVVTESAGGGSFMVIPVAQVTGALVLLIRRLLRCPPLTGSFPFCRLLGLFSYCTLRGGNKASTYMET